MLAKPPCPKMRSWWHKLTHNQLVSLISYYEHLNPPLNKEQHDKIKWAEWRINELKVHNLIGRDDAGTFNTN